MVKREEILENSQVDKILKSLNLRVSFLLGNQVNDRAVYELRDSKPRLKYWEQIMSFILYAFDLMCLWDI